MAGVRYPTLFQLNTRVWLQRLSRAAGQQITLAGIYNAILDGFVENGLDWIYLLSVWQTGAAGRAVSRSNPELRREFETLLPDLTEDDICGSGFAITAYSVGETLGGEAALAVFREKLSSRSIRPPSSTQARGEGRLPRLLATLERVRLLIIDDWGPEPLNAEQRRDMLEIVEDGYGRGATLITSQIPVDRWHDLIGEPTLADAILDRIIHNAHRLQRSGDSMRKQNGPKTTDA